MAIETQRQTLDGRTQGRQLYEVIKGIDFETRELLGKTRGSGLFDLVQATAEGALRCYACTLCRRCLTRGLHRDRLLPRASPS